MTSPNTWLIKSTVVGTVGVFAQTFTPEATGLAERLGTAGLLVAAAALMLKYFMGQNDKKDARIEKLMDEHAVRLERVVQNHEASMAVVVQEIRSAAASMKEVVGAVRGRAR